MLCVPFSPLIEIGSAEAARFQEDASQLRFRLKSGDYGEAVELLYHQIGAEQRPFIPERDDPFYEAATRHSPSASNAFSFL